MSNESRFDQRLKSVPTQIWNKISQIEELKGQWKAGAELSPQVLGRLKKSVLITSAGASTRIEGAHLSDEDVEKLMRGLAIQKFADRDKQEVMGYYQLLQNIFESWQRLRLSEGLIKHFHQELLKYVDKDRLHRGEYKKTENKIEMITPEGEHVTLFNTTPPYLTPNEMQELVEWTRDALEEKKHHPLVIVGNFIVDFLNIHPFQDGNGRMSRILTNLLLLQQGYPYMPYVSHEKLIEAHKSNYYIALRKSQKTFKSKHEVITPWLEFFLEIILEQSKAAVALLSKEKVDQLFSPKQMAVWKYLQSVPEATPLEISRHAKVARPTVNQVLDKLLRLKKIERIGLGRTTRYRKI